MEAAAYTRRTVCNPVARHTRTTLFDRLPRLSGKSSLQPKLLLTLRWNSDDDDDDEKDKDKDKHKDENKDKDEDEDKDTDKDKGKDDGRNKNKTGPRTKRACA